MDIYTFYFYFIRKEFIYFVFNYLHEEETGEVEESGSY